MKKRFGERYQIKFSMKRDTQVVREVLFWSNMFIANGASGLIAETRCDFLAGFDKAIKRAQIS
jgi:hypothetical protein